jgi:hypothetical protein
MLKRLLDLFVLRLAIEGRRFGVSTHGSRVISRPLATHEGAHIHGKADRL